MCQTVARAVSTSVDIMTSGPRSRSECMCDRRKTEALVSTCAPDFVQHARHTIALLPASSSHSACTRTRFRIARNAIIVVVSTLLRWPSLRSEISIKRSSHYVDEELCTSAAPTHIVWSSNQLPCCTHARWLLCRPVYSSSQERHSHVLPCSATLNSLLWLLPLSIRYL